MYNSRKKDKEFDEQNVVSVKLDSRNEAIVRAVKVLETIGRLKERYSTIAQYYIIDVKKDHESKNAIDIVWEEKKTLLKYDIASQEIIQKTELLEIFSSLNDISVEGVTFNNEGNIYFVHDDKEEGAVYKFKY